MQFLRALRFRLCAPNAQAPSAEMRENRAVLSWLAKLRRGLQKTARPRAVDPRRIRHTAVAETSVCLEPAPWAARPEISSTNTQSTSGTVESLCTVRDRPAADDWAQGLAGWCASQSGNTRSVYVGPALLSWT